MLNNALPKMKTDIKVISAALSCYYGGMPLDAIQRHLNQQYGIYLSEMGIYNWVIRFSKEAVDRTKDFKPKVGDTWIADETVLKVGGKNVWFFDVIDEDTRYLLASRLATSRTIKETALVMKEARDRAGKAPKRIITDKMSAYPDGIERVFGRDTEHIQSKPFTDVDSTNVIERFHGTLKDRTKVVRGFKNMKTAELLTDAWLVYYNFFKEHETLGNVPPAQAMKLAVPFKDWAEVVKGTKVNIPSEAVSVTVTEQPPATPKKKTSRARRRKPRSLAGHSYVVASLTQVRR